MTSALLDHPKSKSAFFQPTEYVLMGLIVFVLAANIWVDLQEPQRVDWGSFLIPAIGGFGLALMGAYYRYTYKNVAWLGKAASTIALGSLLGMFLGVLFHLRMPRPEPVLTDALLAMDAWFGFHWPDMVDWVAGVPYLGTFLRIVYLSSLYQIIALVGLLAWLKRDRDVDALILTNGLGLMLVYVVWQSFPNISQSTYFPIARQTAAATDLVTHSTYGRMILDYAQNGLPLVSRDKMLGAVAFPSYHMVMCALVVAFARRTVLFWPFLIINIIMIPAILLHGAHHIADVLGGVAVMCAAMIPAYMISNYFHKDDDPVAQSA